jgi:hypothetical protein
MYTHTLMPVHQTEVFPSLKTSPQQESPHQEISDIPTEVLSKKKVHYDATNRIVLQRFCDGALHEKNSTNIPDQGIRFDKDRNPWDKNESRSRDGHHENKPSRVPNNPAQSHTGTLEGMTPEMRVVVVMTAHPTRHPKRGVIPRLPHHPMRELPAQTHWIPDTGREPHDPAKIGLEV